MNVIEYRLCILEDLYNQAKSKASLHLGLSDRLLTQLGIKTETEDDDDFESPEEKELIFNLLYLEQKGYIEVQWGTHNQIFDIMLLGAGIDIVEFNHLGSNIANPEKESKFETLLNKLASSGTRILEGTSIGALNIALSQLLK